MHNTEMLPNAHHTRTPAHSSKSLLSLFDQKPCEHSLTLGLHHQRSLSRVSYTSLFKSISPSSFPHVLKLQCQTPETQRLLGAKQEIRHKLSALGFDLPRSLQSPSRQPRSHSQLRRELEGLGRMPLTPTPMPMADMAICHSTASHEVEPFLQNPSQMTTPKSHRLSVRIEKDGPCLPSLP